MIDHVSVPVRDLKQGTQFYTEILAPLGLSLLVDRPATTGFGKKYPEFWLNARPDMADQPADTGCHICLRVREQKSVEDFHAAALKNGGSCDGAPGLRQAAMTTYYGAFIKDPFGNKIEAVCFPAKVN